MALSPEEIRSYEDRGYLLVEGVVGADTLAEIRAVIDAYKQEAKDVRESNYLFDLGPGHSQATPRLRRLKDPVDHHEVFAALSRCDAIVDIVADLLGPDVRFDHSKLNFKPSGGKAAIQWHQDWAFYPHTNDSLLAVGVMIEDCTAENGPLMVIPESHKGPG